VYDATFDFKMAIAILDKSKIVINCDLTTNYSSLLLHVQAFQQWYSVPNSDFQR